jgi:hypothetical protein
LTKRRRKFLPSLKPNPNLNPSHKLKPNLKPKLKLKPNPNPNPNLNNNHNPIHDHKVGEKSLFHRLCFFENI